ncbi:MAG: ribbon-helix-helix protein, CopG family [Treponema sp.]|nr:ribbon-helix-helix protein, CopG family [Treponema sp.]
MSKNNKKEEHERYSVQMQLRFTQKMAELIEAKALEHHTSNSEIIRQAVMNYVNRSMSDTEIVHASLIENSRKIRFLESKIELMALIVLQQTKLLMKTLPNKQVNSDFVVEKEYEKFMNECSSILKTNHTGKLEAMILDAYEQQGSNS